MKKTCSANQEFLSDPGPIIVYPSQWLTDSLTHWLSHDLVEDWMNCPKYADYADHADYAEYAEYAKNAKHLEYAKHAEYAKYTKCA